MAKLGKIERLVEDRHLLTHPFYRRWQAGKVPFDVLREYARQYYAYESALPSFLEGAMAHVPDGPARQALAENLADESGRPEPHPELWIRFAEALGLSREEVTRAEPLPRTANLVQTYATLCGKGAEEGLAALFAYEAQFAAVAAAKAEGLRRLYGVADARALAFFDLHAAVDDGHAESIRLGLVESERALEAAHLAVEAWWGMLDQFEAMASVSTA